METRRWLLSAMIGLAVAACGGTDAENEAMIETARQFDEALWNGDVETALSLVTEDFAYQYPSGTISSPAEFREAFEVDGDSISQIRVESSGFAVEMESVVWESIRYFGDNVGEAVLLTALFDGDLIDRIAEQSSPTTAEDAVGCEGDYPYSWHNDYEADATGVSSDPVTAAMDAFPEALNDVVFEQIDLDAEAPMSGGHGPIVRAGSDGYTVGFIFLTEGTDGTLLVDGVTACNNYLEPVEQDHG